MKKRVQASVCASLAFMVVATPSAAQTSTPTPPAEPQNPAPTDAAQQTGALDDIVVTAQKREENPQRVPIAITTVTPARLQASGVTDIQSLPSAVPGLQVLNIGGAVVPRIRGVGAGYTAAGVESPVATYVDGVYLAYGADANLDLSDVSQVTALKGPQGTLFGRNATGGVLQVQTRDPSFDFGGSVRVSFDNYLTARSDAFLTGGLASSVAGSLSVSYAHQGKGYGTNIATGNDTYKLDHLFSLRAKIRADLDDRTDVRISGDFSSRAGPRAGNFRPFPGYSSRFPVPFPSRKWDVNNWADAESDYSGGGGSITINRELGFADLKSITAFRDSKNEFAFINVPTTVVIQRLKTNESARQFTEELQLVSPSNRPLTWAIGVFYISARARATTAVTNYGSAAAVYASTAAPAAQRTESIAAYAQATYAIAPATRLTAGLRYTSEQKDFRGRNLGFSANGSQTTIFDSGEVRFKFDKPAWRISFDQDLASNTIAYLSYNRGVKSGGFSLRAPANPAFQPEKLDAYEVGLKSELLERALRLNLSGFYYDYSNIQIFSYLPSGVGAAILNGASAESYGLDAEVEAQISDRLRITGGANYLHARYTDFPRAPFAIPNPGNQGAVTVLRDGTGKTLAYSPSLTYTLGADLTVPTTAGDFVLNVTDNYNSGFFSEADNLLKQDSYHFLNASVRWSSEDERFGARLFINNILNEAVASQFATTTSAFLADYTNPPRVIGGSFEVKF